MTRIAVPIKVAATGELIEVRPEGKGFVADINNSKWPKLDPARVRLYNG